MIAPAPEVGKRAEDSESPSIGKDFHYLTYIAILRNLSNPAASQEGPREVAARPTYLATFERAVRNGMPDLVPGISNFAPIY